MIANTLAVKQIVLGPFTLTAAIIVFPLAYIFGDVLTEVYGFRRARSIIWWSFTSLALMSLFYYIATLLPPAPYWVENQPVFALLFGLTPRIAAASFVAFLVGELINSAVLSKLKVRTEGRHFWFRAMGSTILGQGADSFIFNYLAFFAAPNFTPRLVLVFAVSGWILKSLYELMALPLTYVVVTKLKTIEGLDVFDEDISYSPLPG